jgi:hypothetical protein
MSRIWPTPGPAEKAGNDQIGCQPRLKAAKGGIEAGETDPEIGDADLKLEW